MQTVTVLSGENKTSKCSIAIEGEYSADDFVEFFVKPLMMGLGYDMYSIETALGEVNDG